jgi:putative tryptophan/tyrosine transport system substrate-binding protein
MKLRRRTLLSSLAAALAAPLAVPRRAAQAQSLRRVAVLTPSQPQWQPVLFREALAAHGYRDPGNLQITVASAEGRLDRLPALAEALAGASPPPDVIVAVNAPGTFAAARATARLPIVSAAVADPVLLGIVGNIARPEGNVTGVANMASDITSKRVALLKEAVPSLRRVALLLHPEERIVAPQLQDIARSAGSLDVEHREYPIRNLADLETALETAKAWGAQGIVRLAGQGLELGPDTARLALALRLPSMLLARSDVEAGALMSYFADQAALWRRVAAQVARLLDGASPTDLPFELPTNFELAVNLRTARALGIALPPLLLARADVIVE